MNPSFRKLWEIMLLNSMKNVKECTLEAAYVAPAVEVIEVQVEKGFATSTRSGTLELLGDEIDLG